jgi:hypothetical protein
MPVPRRVLNVLALLLLVLLPLQGSIQGTSAAADTSRATRTPKVFMKIEKGTVTTKQRAKARIALGLRSVRSQAQASPGLGTGRVSVAIKGGGGKAKRVDAKLVKGKAVVRLPKLSRGTYKVRATFLGNALLGKARSKIRTLKVVRPGGVGASGCASTSANVPDGSDGRGGCFPGPANTGPSKPASSMTTYPGPCTITRANVVIDSKVVNCRTLVVTGSAGGLVLKNSYLNGSIVQSGGAAAYTVSDSFIDSGIQFPACSDGSCPAGKYACGDINNGTVDCGVNGSNFTILRTEIINSSRAAYCTSNCLIKDNYFHGTNLWPDKSNGVHSSSVREEQNLTLRHNSLHCSYTGPFINDEIGCSADLTGYPDFAPVKNNTVDGNLFVASPGSGFCAYGGATPGKPYSGDPTNATNQRFTNNVFQRGSNRKCGAYGPVTNFDKTGSGNVWSGNVWDNGTSVSPAM